MGLGANVRSEYDHENAPLETCIDKEFDHGPGEEFQDFECRKLITRILLVLQIYENQTGHQRGAQKFPIPTWFAMWLANLDRLEATAEAFERDPGPTFIEKSRPQLYKLIEHYT